MSRWPLIVLSVVLAAAAAGCGPNPRIMNSAAEPTPDFTPSNSAPLSGFEADIESMRTAEFQSIYVFRRKDGAPLDGEDRSFINEMKTPEVNRVRVSDEGKAVIFGMNFAMPEENLRKLGERFAFEDFSPKPVTNSPSPSPSV
ncbi:MAG TPA: hypothetical protein VK918_10290 [Pyrinomonadaceae bacterium]|nr:hypothetical protein [Pyrinomonadaceae bacterium]